MRTAIEATGLPLVPHLDSIVSALVRRRLTILRADPGSGKSSLMPLALMGRPEFAAGKIVVLEPRRLAAVSVAARMAELVGEGLGGQVGYAVRLERRIGRSTRIEVVTEGLLVQRLLRDPFLDGVATVVFDEFHERSVDTDLALALILDLRKLRPDLAVLIMSATLDGSALADFLSKTENDDVPAIDCPGRPYPVRIGHRPIPDGRGLGDHCAHALLAELGSHPTDDILVFLPGRREIADAQSVLVKALPDFEIFQLHGSLDLADQRRIIAVGGSRRRIILATNIAETSLTVPGVAWVVDSGWVRLERYHQASGLDRLSLERISRQSAAQRAGRAGRTGPGACLRLWDEREFLPAETEPTMRRTDLSALALVCALWGAKRPDDLPWLTPPIETAWQAGTDLLRDLGALDDHGGATALGRTIAGFGVAPRLAALMVRGAAAGHVALACAVAAVLADRDGSGLDDDPDLRLRLDLLRRSAYGGATGALSVDGRTRAWAERVKLLVVDLMARLSDTAGDTAATASGFGAWSAADENDIGAWIAAGFPDRIAARQLSGVFRFPSGREGRASGSLANEAWLAVAAADAGDRSGFIRLAAPLTETDALNALAPHLEREQRTEWTGLRPHLVETVKAGRLVVNERRRPCPVEELPAAFAAFLAERGLAELPWNDGGGSPARLLARIRYLVKYVPAVGSDPDWTDEGLIRDAAALFGPYLKSRGDALDGAGLAAALRGRIGRRTPELDTAVPEYFLTPANTHRLIDYTSGEPALEVKIQEIFGLAATPRILGLPVSLRLLSPAERPLQITRDLAGFWRETYAAVRREMRGRYPRHYWPEDPLAAEATSRPKPRGR